MKTNDSEGANLVPETKKKPPRYPEQNLPLTGTETKDATVHTGRKEHEKPAPVAPRNHA